MPLEPHTIHHGDCIEQMNALPAGGVDLVFADPPFNIGYDYDVYDDKLGYQQYLDWSSRWIAAVYRVLQPHGTFWLAIGDEYAAELKIESQRAGFICRSWVIWYYTFGVNCSKKFTRSHAHLFHFVKDRERFTFRDDDLENRVPSARELVYNDRRANPDGRLPDDTWIMPPADTSGGLQADELDRLPLEDLTLPNDHDQTFTLRPQDVEDGFSASEDTWYFSRVAGTFKERAGFHGCQMPEQLLGRILRTCSYPGDFVLDPFSGSATTLAVAKKLNRPFIGFDLSEDYVRFGRQRLEGIQPGDPLNGAPEPTKKTFNERRQKADAIKRSQRKSRQAAKVTAGQPLFSSLQELPDDGEPTLLAEKTNHRAAPEIDVDGLLTAFRETHDGFSADRLVADPELNEAFATACQRHGLAGNRQAWNVALFRLRKSGKLAKIATTRRTELPLQAADASLHAAEIALQQMIASEETVSLDELLCDPERAEAFDRRAENWGATASAFAVRWAALQLRKICKTARVRGETLTPPATSAWSEPLAIDAVDASTVTAESGLYLVEDTQQRPRYIGETSDLRARFATHFGDAAQAEWQQVGSGLIVKWLPLNRAQEGPLAHQSSLAQALRPPLNYRELYATD